MKKPDKAVCEACWRSNKNHSDKAVDGVIWGILFDQGELLDCPVFIEETTVISSDVGITECPHVDKLPVKKEEPVGLSKDICRACVCRKNAVTRTWDIAFDGGMLLLCPVFRHDVVFTTHSFKECPFQTEHILGLQ